MSKTSSHDLSYNCGSIGQSLTADSTFSDHLQFAVNELLSSWDESRAMTLDMLPRARFIAQSPEWRRFIWLLIRVTGPGVLACRPQLWRDVCLDTTYKKGPASWVTSFRMLSVRAQMGLLQEAMVSDRLRPNIRSFLCHGQSGYHRDVEDATFVNCNM